MNKSLIVKNNAKSSKPDIIDILFTELGHTSELLLTIIFKGLVFGFENLPLKCALHMISYLHIDAYQIRISW